MFHRRQCFDPKTFFRVWFTLQLDTSKQVEKGKILRNIAEMTETDFFWFKCNESMSFCPYNTTCVQRSETPFSRYQQPIFTNIDFCCQQNNHRIWHCYLYQRLSYKKEFLKHKMLPRSHSSPSLINLGKCHRPLAKLNQSRPICKN